MEFFFEIHFKDKESAKKLGAKWNQSEKRWFAPNTQIKEQLLSAGFKESEKPITLTESQTICQKCRKIVENNTIIYKQYCKCCSCSNCNEKLGVASHVFFCERYGSDKD